MMKKTVFLLLLSFTAAAAFADSVAASPVKTGSCSRYSLSDLDRMSYDCLGVFDSNLDSEVNEQYQRLLKRAEKKDPKLHGLSPAYFKEIRKKWQAYKDVLCDDPTVTTDLKTSADWYIQKCRIEQAQYHLKSLQRF